MKSNKLIVSVFGNPDLPEDAVPVSLISDLQKKFPEIEFRHQDPNEECTPPSDTWWIIDAVKGIDDVTLITNTDILAIKRRLTMHDYDLGMHLVLLSKINPQLKLRIIGVPAGTTSQAVLPGIIMHLSTALRENATHSSYTDHTHG